MKHKKLKLSVLLLVLGLITQAQQAIMATGGNASGSGGTVAFSIGQLAYTSFSDSNGTVAEGVQQAIEVYRLGVDSLIDLELVAYPNPTTNALTLKVGDSETSTLSFQLFDISGILVESRKIKNTTETIKMGHLPSAMYVLKVTNKNNEEKTFKIIKN